MTLPITAGRDTWIQECLTAFQSKENVCNIFTLDDCELYGLDQNKLSQKARRAMCCNYTYAYYLHLIPNSLQNIYFYSGYVHTRIEGLRYNHHCAIVIVIPSKNICILTRAGLETRQVQRFLNQMSDNMKTEVLLLYKRWALFEDIDFSVSM